MIVTPALDALDRAACFAVRRAVFIGEQGIAEAEEFDAADDTCLHFLGRLNGRAVATARLIGHGACAKIGRVAVLRDVRRQGVGAALIRAVERHAARSGHATVALDAQVAVMPFYARLGYVASGPVFDDAGIPHRRMHRDLP